VLALILPFFCTPPDRQTKSTTGVCGWRKFVSATVTYNMWQFHYCNTDISFLQIFKSLSSLECFGKTYCLHLQGWSDTVCFSEMASAGRSTGRYNPEYKQQRWRCRCYTSNPKLICLSQMLVFRHTKDRCRYIPFRPSPLIQDVFLTEVPYYFFRRPEVGLVIITRCSQHPVYNLCQQTGCHSWYCLWLSSIHPAKWQGVQKCHCKI
jgi:hypothetical protein